MSDRKFEPKEDTGNLWKVDDRKSEKHAEYSGEFKVRCPHCGRGLLGWLNAWVNEAKDGRKYFKISFKHRQPGGGQ